MLGASHESADFATRERLADALTPRAVAATVSGLVDEAVTITTCDRTEVVLACRDSRALAAAEDALRDLAGTGGGDIRVLRGRAAIRHVIRVSMGLDALILGEHEIQGQVGHAWRSAKRAGTAGPVMAALFQRALHTAGRARAEVGLGRGRTSIASLAFEHVLPALSGRDGVEVVIVGADPAARGLGRRLVEAVSGTVWATGPGGEAARFARDIGAERLALDGAADVLQRCSLLVGAAPLPAAVAAALRAPHRAGPLLIMDMCMPRSVPPDIGSLPGIRIDTLDDLRPLARRADDVRRRDAAAAARIASEGTAWMTDWLAGREAVSAIRGVLDDVEALRRRELDRAIRHDDTPETVERLQRLSRRLAAAFAHAPATRLRYSDDPDTDAAVLRRLFGPVTPSTLDESADGTR